MPDWGRDTRGRVRKPCPEDPEVLGGQPIGMYHCPGCGAMQMAGMTHLPPDEDYEEVYGQDWPPGYEDWSQNDDRNLDLLIAQKVTNLPGAGWYKRSSCHDSEWVPATGPEDFTEDHPAWKASRYYLRSNDIRAIPYYSTDWNEAMRLRTRLVREGRGRELEAEVIRLAGTWLMASPRDICRAALILADDKAPTGPVWDEAAARARAFRSNDIDLEMALVALDTVREDLEGTENKLLGLSCELDIIDAVVQQALPHGLVYDRRDQRIRAIARERDEALAKLPGFTEAEKP